MSREQAQATLYDAAERGDIEYIPPLHGRGPGHFIVNGERIATNSTRVTDAAQSLQQPYTKPAPWEWDMEPIYQHPQWGFNEIYTELYEQARLYNYSDIAPEDIERETERIMAPPDDADPPTVYAPGFGWEYL